MQCTVLHPITNTPVEGVRLRAGDTFQKGDLFACSSGKWVPILNVLVGQVLSKRTDALFVRPSETQQAIAA